MNKHEIYKTLVISTAHLTEDWVFQMETTPDIPLRCKHGASLIFQKHEFGFRIWADQDHLPAFFKPAAKLAKKLNCRWIEYDCDGPEIEELKSYEW